jgi:hypothetical protein
MNIALLFNSDQPKFRGFYGDAIRQIVFGLGILQRSNRHMKVSVGDVLIYSHSRTSQSYDELTDRVYFSGTWSLMIDDRLRATFRKATVYALTFENMTETIAKELHAALDSEESYLGLMEVDYTYGPHLALFRNSMITLYRIEGSVGRVFYSMGDKEDLDGQQLVAMARLGYTDVGWEDRGAHGTIFDDYDTLEHFERVAAFRDAVTPLLLGGSDSAYELVMVLEDLSPQLFNVLGAAIAALERAQNEEEVAQAALSGRRYMEKLADVLFPAREDLYQGRQVGREQYRNRIWAFVGDNYAGEPEQLAALGGEVDRLVKEFNRGLHGDEEKSRIYKALADVGALTAALLALNPADGRKPYFAHQRKIVELMTEPVLRHGDHDA